MDVLDHHRQDMFYCVIGVFHIVASVVVCLRLYTRFFIVRGFGVDDWAIVAALVSLLVNLLLGGLCLCQILVAAVCLQ